MKQKMIFLDMDGTLLNDEKKIPEANKQAIDEALAMGHKVLICTGRPLASVKKQIPLLGLDRPGCYAIAFNGGLIWDSGEDKVIFQQTMPLEFVEYLFERAHEAGIHIQTYTDDAVISRFDTPEGQDYGRIVLVERKIVPDVLAELNGREPCKALAIAPGYERTRIEAFRDSLLAWGEGKVDIAFSCYEYLEIVPKGISKGNAVLRMAELLKIPVEDTIAVGDAENDISMIEAAGVGVVMKNASSEIKQYADYVTESTNNEAGVAEVIRKFMLGFQ